MKFFTTLLAVLFLAAASLQAEQVFVLFDGTCGDRVLYEQAIAQQPRMDYYAYHFLLLGGDRLILETGAEGATVQNYLPQGYLYCGNPMLNLELAERINNGTDKVFVLLPTNNNQYLIQPVVMAASFQRRGNAFSYNSPLTGYQFDADNGIIGVNLAYNNPGAKVYFEGRDNSACSGYFLFRQLKPNSSYPVIDYRMAPEIGVMERRLGSDGISSTGGAIVARSVNGVPIANYLASICAGATAAATGQPAPPANPGPGTYSNQPTYTPPVVNVPVVPQPESAASQGGRTVTSNVGHTVAKGETLYSISRKYNTSVDAIRTNNGLAGNTVFPGQQLTVATTTTTSVPMSVPGASNPVAVNVPQTTVPTLPYNPGNVAGANPGAAQPTPYGSVQEPRGGTSVYGEDAHMVQPGETVASLALRYGYTSAKFREINELGPNDVVRVGEQLKTSACNCPVAVPATQPAAPTSYGTAPATPQPYGTQPTPQSYYGTQPAVQPYGTQPAAVPSYGQPTYGQPVPQPQVQPTGTPVGVGVPTYQAPTPAVTAPSINNNPNFGQIVPNTSATPTATMGDLEARSGSSVPATPNPSTYGSYPAPTGSYPAPASAPSTYGSQPASPSAYGTPVGANSPTAPTQPSNRSFHLVQEGETPYAIARRYGITTTKLRELNKLSPTDVIVPFQKLYVN
ncbi:MAG: LysM repeat protein [Neolewinella sp.]|jgi:LysM repeat protein